MGSIDFTVREEDSGYCLGNKRVRVLLKTSSSSGATILRDAYSNASHWNKVGLSADERNAGF